MTKQKDHPSKGEALNNPFGPSIASLHNGLVQAEAFVANALLHAILRIDISPAAQKEKTLRLFSSRFEAIKKHLSTWHFSVYAPLQNINTDLAVLSSTVIDVLPALYELCKKLDAKSKKSFVSCIKSLVAKVDVNEKGLRDAQTYLTKFIKDLDARTDQLVKQATARGSERNPSSNEEFVSAIHKRRSYLRAIAASASVFVLSRPVQTFVPLTYGTNSVFKLFFPCYVVETQPDCIPDIAQSKIAQKDEELSKLLSEQNETDDYSHAVCCISDLLADLKDQATTIQSSLDLLISTYQSISDQLSAYTNRAKVQRKDRDELKSFIKKAYWHWHKVESRTILVSNQLTTLPVTELSQYSSVAAARVTLSISRASEECKRLGKLRFSGPVPVQTQDSASEAADRIVEYMNALKVVINDLNDAVQNVPSTVRECQQYLDQVVEDAEPVEESTNVTAEKLDSLARKWLPDLKELQEQVDDPNQEVSMDEARTTVGGLSDSFSELEVHLEESERLVLNLDSSAITARRELNSKVGELNTEIAGLEKSIELLEEEVRALEKQIRDYEISIAATCWIMIIPCLITKALMDECILKVKDKKKTISNKKQQIEDEKQRLGEAYDGRNWCESTNTMTTECTVYSDKLATNIQVLRTETSSASSVSNPDDLFEAWLSAQLGTIISALEQLVQPTRSSTAKASPSAVVPTLFELMFGASTKRNLISVKANVQDRASSLEEAMADVAAQGILVSSGGSIVLIQPRVSLQLVPTVAQNQALLQTSCNHWKYDYRMELLKLITACGTTGTLVVSIIQVMLDEEMNSDMIAEGLELCKSKVQELKETTEETYSEVQDFIKFDLDKDFARMSTSATEVEREYNSEDGRLAEIAAEMNLLQIQINAFNSEVAKGATTAVLKALGAQLKFALSIVIGGIEIPDPDEGASFLKVIVNTGQNWVVEGASAELEAAALEAMEEAIGGDDGREAQAARFEQMRDLVIERALLTSALVSFSTVFEQLLTIVDAAKNLERNLKYIPYDIEDRILDINSLIYYASGNNVDMQELYIRLKKMQKEYSVLPQLSTNLKATIIDSVVEEEATIIETIGVEEY